MLIYMPVWNKQDDSKLQYRRIEGAGGLAERFKAPVLKTGDVARHP
jgi:hypothetical protein